MASKIKKLMKRYQVWILLFFMLISLLIIPSYKPEGVAASFVAKESPFYKQVNEGDIIRELNSQAISTLDDYAEAVATIKPGEMTTIVADGQTYTALAPAAEDDNETAYLGIHVTTTSRHNINLGLDLQGGARVMLNPIPEKNVTMDSELIDTTTSVLMARMNAYGLKNVLIRTIGDVHGNNLIEVEMAGEGSEKVVDLVKSVGKYDIKIFNETILTGEYIVPPIGEPQRDMETGVWQVQFTLNNKGAKLLRESYVAVAPEAPTSCTLDEDCNVTHACSRGLAGGICLPRIEMYLDEMQVYSAPPAQTLYQTWVYGEESKTLLAQTGEYEDAQRVHIALEAGRLPKQIKELEVVSQDYMDPKLGKDFIKGAVYAALAALLAVLIVVSLRYRRLSIVLPILFIDIAEVIIILGMAAMIKWSLDLPAIAGLIAVLGTAVDQQIVITDEVLAGSRTGQAWSLRKGVKTAFKIVIIAASTTIAAMIPLAYPGFTGLYVLRGFAIVTILGVLIGLFITRPAYAKMAEILLGE